MMDSLAAVAEGEDAKDNQTGAHWVVNNKAGGHVKTFITYL